MSEHTAVVLDYPTDKTHHHHEPPTFFESLGEPGMNHHFEDAGQQKEAATLGMWLFLATEVLLFGGMFAGYFTYRWAYPEAWEAGSRMLNPVLGSINTAVLLGSSLCVALAIHAAQQGHRRSIVVYLILTIVLGAGFLGIKAVEYTADYHEEIIPWMSTFAHGAAHHPHHPVAEHLIPRVRLFMLFYFIMTMIHATHMIVGMAVVAVIAFLAHRGHYTPKYYTPVEMTGLYWHFVDIVWVFLLPALYFVRPF